MPATVESPQVHEPKPAPAPAEPACDKAPAAPEPTVYWGDRFAVRMWFVGASVLALLHVIDWLYYLLRP